MPKSSPFKETNQLAGERPSVLTREKPHDLMALVWVVVIDTTSLLAKPTTNLSNSIRPD
jgi:hypothetical protein